jgi:hypothetical protein
MSSQTRTILLIVIGALFLIALCVIGVVLGKLFLFPPSAPATQQQDPSLIYTAAAQTLQVQLTMAAAGTMPVLPSPTSVVVQPSATQPASTESQPLSPSDTPVPTNTPVPTATSVPPTATTVPIPCDRALFVKDVSYPDNTEVATGSTFVKTWRLMNNGSCTWTSGYALIFVSGDAMNGPASSQLTTGTVPPGGTIDVSVTLKAPDTVGTYRGDWKLRNAAGATFGIGDYADKTFWVQIKAVTPTTPTPTVTPTATYAVAYDFIARGPDASWRNSTQSIPWGDPGSDDPGVAVNLSNVKMEDGKTYAKLLATFPERIYDGEISGLYPSYTIQNGDHFRAQIGLRSDCGNGKVRFQLKYVENGGEVMLGEWIESCDGKLTTVDIDLSALKGHTVQFLLVVKTEGDFKQDKSLWILPRIEH